MKRGWLLTGLILLAGCGTGENSVPDAKPVNPEIRSSARTKEIDGPKEFARKRGLSQSGRGRTVSGE